MRREFAVVLLLLIGTACQRQSDTIAVPPLPPPPSVGQREHDGFLIQPRPGCTSNVLASIDKRDLPEIKRLAADGAAFTCGSVEDPLPLDAAVMQDDPALVRLLLGAHADPTARWSSHGDRFPLQEALEAETYRRPSVHRDQILRMLLTHGADPNQRWCLFESRGGESWQQPCVSRAGVTPLMWAAAADEPATTFLLLQAGADPALENQLGANALDLANGEGVFYQLLSVISAKRGIPYTDMLQYVGDRGVKDPVAGPWDETPLTSAIRGSIADAIAPPPPPALPRIPGVGPSRVPAARYPSRRAGRVRALLALGANANVRLSSDGVDWTPLALAIEQGDDEIVRALLRYGADPNARWCVALDQQKASHVHCFELECNHDSGTTPLMFASSVGDLNVLGALLERKDVELELKDWKGRTAVEYAERAAHPDGAYELKRAARLRMVIAQPR